MSPALPPTPWASTPARRSEALRRRASTLMWGLGGVLVVCFGCCSFLVASLGMMSVQEVEKLMRQGQPTPPVSDFHGWLIPMAFLMLAVGFFPGVAYIAMGFPVRSGLRGPTKATLVLVIVQAVIMALGTLPAMIGAIATSDVGALGLSVVGGGGVLATQVMLATTLVQILQGPGVEDELETDPWNEPDA